MKQTDSNAEIQDTATALSTNVNAVRAVARAVEGTIGPKGLDTMLVDNYGDVIVTNDGVTILEKMEVNHPAAKMLINIAKAQQEAVGDGTTTATIMAGSMVSEGLFQVIKGVPVARVIEGIKYSLEQALLFIKNSAIKIELLDDENLYNIAMVSGREHSDIAKLVVEAAKLIGREKLCDNNFKLAETIIAKESADNEVFMGVVVTKERMSKEMPDSIENVGILLVDDALEPEEMTSEALRTDAGFQRYLLLQEEFKNNIHKIIDTGVKLILVDRGVNEVAEEMLTDAGVMVLRRVEHAEMEKVAEHIGARMIKRNGLKKSLEELTRYIGFAQKVYEDNKLEQVRILGGKGKPMATVLVGAATQEVVGERARIAKDAASSVQATVKEGYIAGGGALEIATAQKIEGLRENIGGMSAYGVDCVVNALKRPLTQIINNAGYNPLEKLEEVIATQKKLNNTNLAIDCNTGNVADMLSLGVIDPMLVKYHAVKAAGEVAIAILRIDTIIRKKDESNIEEN